MSSFCLPDYKDRNSRIFSISKINFYWCLYILIIFKNNFCGIFGRLKFNFYMFFFLGKLGNNIILPFSTSRYMLYSIRWSNYLPGPRLPSIPSVKKASMADNLIWNNAWKERWELKVISFNFNCCFPAPPYTS